MAWAMVTGMVVATSAAAGAAPIGGRPVTASQVADCAGLVAHPALTLGPDNGVVGESYALIADSGGTVPAKGDTVTMVFDGPRTAWLLLTSAGGDLSFSGSYSYSGPTMSLSFTASGFSRKGTFHFAPGQAEVTLPFQALSTKPGSSKWAVQPVDPMGGATAVALATMAQTTTGATPAAVVEAAANFIAGQTGAPITQSPQFAALARADAAARPGVQHPLARLGSFAVRGQPAAPALMGAPRPDAAPGGPVLDRYNPMINGITELPDGLDMQTTFGASVDMPLLDGLETPGSTGETLTKDGTFSNALNIDKSVPSPHNAISDPKNKTALFFLPFQGSQKNQFLRYQFSINNSGYIYAIAVQEFFDPYIAQEEGLLTQDGYKAPVVLGPEDSTTNKPTATTATVFNFIKAMKKNPGVVYFESHGGPDGSVITADFLGNTQLTACTNFLAIRAQLMKMGMPGDAVGLGAPPLSGTSPTYNAIYLSLHPVFWKWLHNGRRVDLTHSLVYLSVCDVDQDPSLAVEVGARALFTYNVDVEERFSNTVGLYLLTMLTKKSFTAEEVYYNMLLVDETGTTVYAPDLTFNGLFKRQQDVTAKNLAENNEDRARKKLPPQPPGPKSDIYNVLDAYGTQTYGTTFPYISNGWLSKDVQGGAIFYLIISGREQSTGGTVKQGLKNLKICWDAWWSKGKLPGISSVFCQQAVAGYPPTPDEYWYARYLLSGVRKGFSDFYVPRFTLNDGA